MTPVSATVLQSVPAPVVPVVPLAGPIQQSPPPIQQIQQIQQIQPQSAGDPITSTIMAVNSNPYLIGVFMLLLNLGGRFLSLELTKKQEALLQQPWVRPIIFFTVIFMATRNVVAAFWVTILFFFIIWVVANENSPFCMIPSWCGHNIEEQKQTYLNNVQHLRAQ